MFVGNSNNRKTVIQTSTEQLESTEGLGLAPTRRPWMRRLREAIVSRVSTESLQSGALLMATGSIGNVLQYFFHFFVSRMLGPAEYGVLNSVLALSVIVGVPGGVVTTVITQNVSRFFAQKELGKVASLLTDSTKMASLVGIVLFALFAAGSGALASFLNLTSGVPIVVMATGLALAGGAAVSGGALQGLQRFKVIAANGFLGPAFRLLGGMALVSLGFGASGALGASTLAGLLTLGISFYFLRDVFVGQTRSHDLTLKHLSRYAGIVLIGSLAFIVFTNADLLIVKHYFSPSEAGYYSAAAVLGKTVLFFPGAVATLMFPKTSRRHALGESGARLARMSLLAVDVLCGSGGLVLALFPALAVRLLFGNQFDASVPLVGLYGLAMGLFALVQLLLAYYISIEEGRFVILLAGFALGLLGALLVFHGSLFQVILTLTTVGMLILITSEIWLGGLGLGDLWRRRVLVQKPGA